MRFICASRTAPKAFFSNWMVFLYCVPSTQLLMLSGDLLSQVLPVPCAYKRNCIFIRQDGKTCLHVAVWRGHEEVVDLLVKAGADVNIPDSVSTTLPICLSVCTPVGTTLPICLSVLQSVPHFPSVCLSVLQSVPHFPSVCLYSSQYHTSHLPVCLSVLQSVPHFPSACLSVSTPVSTTLPICLSVSTPVDCL